MIESEVAMQTSKYFIYFLICLPLICSAASTLENLEYMTEQYAPYNYQDDDGIPQGLAVEVLNKVWEILETPPQNIDILPWARGYSLALNKKNTMLFSTTRSQSRKDLFKWACPIIDIRIVLISLKKAKMNIRSIEEAKQFKVVAIKSDIGQQLLLDKAFDDNQIYLANFLESAIRMLKYGHVDLLSSAETTTFSKLQEMGENLDQYETAWVLETNPSCFAFHHEVDEKLIEEFQTALDQVNAIPGFIQGLKQKYQLESR